MHADSLLQAILDSILYEPGEWHPPVERKVPTMIPAPDRTILSTPLGLLFNELKMSPHGTVKPIRDLLELALEMDPGRYTTETASSILCIPMTYSQPNS